MSAPLSLEVYVDFICPWCLIGKRNLERALYLLDAMLPGHRLQVNWVGVQLLDDLPADGVDYEHFYRQRLGSAQAVQARRAQVQEAAFRAGLHLDLESIARMPNTASAHRLFRRAATLGSRQQLDGLLERLFAAHFKHRENLGDRHTLLTIAEEYGYPPAALQDCLEHPGQPYRSEVPVPLGGVPCFVLDQRLLLTDAQPPEVLLGSLLQALERHQPASPA